MVENDAYYSIGRVERDTGIGRDTLRVWERRYGFPEPRRNTRGERMYSEAQLRRLQRIRRLLGQGLRPGKLLVLDDTALDQTRSQAETRCGRRYRPGGYCRDQCHAGVESEPGRAPAA